MGKREWFKGEWVIKHKRRGEVIWQAQLRNSLADQGEEAILETYFRNTSGYVATNFYIRFCNDTLADTDTLSSVLNEPTGNGYAATAVARSSVGFPTKSFSGGDWSLTSAEMSITASGGDIGPLTTMYLATTSDNSGLLISYVSLPMARTILGAYGDSLIFQYKITMQ